jgi:hypothetical protein
VLTDKDDTGEPEGGSAFAVDTVADKAVRFGCGAALAFLIFVASAEFGLVSLAEPFGMAGLLTLGVVFIAVVGVLTVTHGERFVRALLNVVKWLV